MCDNTNFRVGVLVFQPSHIVTERVKSETRRETR